MGSVCVKFISIRMSLSAQYSYGSEPLKQSKKAIKRDLNQEFHVLISLVCESIQLFKIHIAEVSLFTFGLALFYLIS